MRALVIRAFREPPELEDVPEPELPPDAALVEVRATGLCRSDWHGWMGHDASIRLPHVPGHEFAGVVAEVGPEVRGISPGDRVTAPFCCGCGACEPCRLGQTQICERDYQPGFTGWGSFAERVLIPVADLNCVPLPDGLAFEAAAALGCRFMTAFAAVGERGKVRAGDWLAVHGCGGVGLSAVMLGRALGARVVAVDVAPGPLARAAELGADETLDGREHDVATSIRELTGGGAHVSIDAIGSAATAAASVRSLRRRGRHVQVGLLAGDERESRIPMAEMISRELEIAGVHGMPVRDYPALLRLIASDAVDPARLIGSRITLEQAGAALAAMDRPAEGITVIAAPSGDQMRG
ncbi:MAG TPA: zinc-dependent alcohol dehydrogenase family protein [Solirubrobacteraceae bacterium]|nr:zinc-dependent alcohol dehydrogenase family protein [Solirubrobacteraceae bacterium]